MQKIIETIVSIPAIYRTIFLLVCSNCFMTFAWYGHLKNMASKPWWLAAIVSWGIALFEYLLQVPANPFSVFFMGEKFRLDFIWAALCLCGAVFFIFRK